MFARSCKRGINGVMVPRRTCDEAVVGSTAVWIKWLLLGGRE